VEGKGLQLQLGNGLVVLGELSYVAALDSVRISILRRLTKHAECSITLDSSALTFKCLRKYTKIAACCRRSLDNRCSSEVALRFQMSLVLVSVGTVPGLSLLPHIRNR
jgi:hypothetical protein